MWVRGHGKHSGVHPSTPFFFLPDDDNAVGGPLSSLRLLRSNQHEDLVAEDEGEEVDAEVGEDVAHPPVRVHGAVDDLGGDARQEQRGREDRSLDLLLHLEEGKG